MDKGDKLLGIIIKEYREKTGLTSLELAERSNVSQGTISHIETGRRMPSYPVLLRLCTALGISVKDLPYTFRRPSTMKDHMLDMKERFNATEDKEMDERRRRALGSHIESKFGVTQINIQISTEILESLNFDEMEDVKQNKIKGFYTLESSIIIDTLSQFIRKNEYQLNQMYKNNIKKALDEQYNRED